MKSRSRARALVEKWRRQQNPLGWFEELYSEANGDLERIPWADAVVNRHLPPALAEVGTSVPDNTLVVGCGLGDDAEFLAAAGHRVTAFDFAPTSIDWCRRRFPQSNVDYKVGDLLDPPTEWRERFALVVEIYTVQSLLPRELQHGGDTDPSTRDLRQSALDKLASLVAPGGQLLLIARGRRDDEPIDQLPWPLSRAELKPLLDGGLHQVSFRDFIDDEERQVRRFVAHYKRPL